jgi:hypothetical protein
LLGNAILEDCLNFFFLLLEDCVGLFLLFLNNEEENVDFLLDGGVIGILKMENKGLFSK